MLEIRLLGQFAVHRDGRPVDLPSRPAQALLAHLALNAPRRQPRERLAGLLWPDADDDAARQGLRNALWKLRTAVGEAMVVADKFAIGLADGAWRCDALALLEADEATATDEELGRAVAGYAGELLPGFYDEWVDLERERLSAAFERKAAALVARLEAAGRWTDVVGRCETWLARAGASEPAYRAMMRAQAGLGDRAGVGAAYRRCVAALDEDLGMPPSDVTTALYRGLLDEAGSPSRAPAAAMPPGDPARVPAFLLADDEYEAPAPPAAREAELAALATVLDAAVRGEGRVVLVSGEAGEGKSTLLAALTDLALARHPDVVVARGACDAFAGEGRAFGPFVEAFRMLTGDVEAGWAAGRIPTPLAQRLWDLVPHALDAAYGRGRPLLGALIDGPTLAQHAATCAARAPVPHLAAFTAMLGGQPAHAGRLDQIALFDACTEFLAALAAVRPIVLLLDDLHWVDATSAGLLLHLARRLQGLPLLVVGAYRPEEARPAAEAGPLSTVLGEVQRTLGQAPLVLGPRDGAAARAFIDALLDREPNVLPEAFRAALARRTGGHALFTVELLDELKDRGVLVRDGLDRWTTDSGVSPDGLPARVEGVLQSRIGRLDDDLRRALAIAAVEGEEFTAEAVARVDGADAWRLLERLAAEAGRRHRLVDELGPVRVQGRRLSRFRFRHNLFQRYLYDGIGPSVRAHLHQAVADALVDLHGPAADAIAVPLGRHYLEAALPDRAVPHLLVAGRAANRVAAHQEALAHLEAAIAVIADLPEGHPRDDFELDLRLELMVALHVTAGFTAPVLAGHGERAVALAEAAGDGERRFRALWNLWLHHAGCLDLPASQAAASALLAAAAGEPDRMLQAHHAAWSGCHQAGDVTAARTHLAEGLALYDEGRHGALMAAYGGHDPGVCRLCYAARMDLMEGAPARAAAQVDEALALATRLGHAYGVSQALVVRIEVATWAGDFAGAIAAADEAIAHAGRHGFPFWGAFAALNRGWALAWCGDPAGLAAIRAFRAAVAHGPGAASSTVFAHEASACLALGLAAEGRTAVEAGLSAVARGGERASTAELHRLRAELGMLADAPDPAAAEADYERAVAIAERQGAHALAYRATEGLARLWGGGPRAAEGHARLAAARARLPEEPPAGIMTAPCRPAAAITPPGD